MNSTFFATLLRHLTALVTRLTAASTLGLGVTLTLLSPPALALPGDLDVSTFGPYSGLPYGQFPVTTSQFFKLHDAIVLPDDRIVAGGTCTATGAAPAGTRFCIAVWTAAGTGVALYVHSSSVNRVSPSAGGAIAAQPDGKIVVTAPCKYSAVGTVNQFCTARFNADFTSDTGFATGFQNTAPSPSTNSDSYANAIALQPDGKIMVAGQCGTGTGTIFCAARLLPDGNPDSTFGGATSLRTFVGLSGTAPFDRVKRIALSTSGQIYLGGDCKDVTGLYRTCIARLNADGTIDQPFTGTSFKPLVLPKMSEGSTDDEVTDMVVQANGEFVFAGACQKKRELDNPGSVRAANGRAKRHAVHARNLLLGCSGLNGHVNSSRTRSAKHGRFNRAYLYPTGRQNARAASVRRDQYSVPSASLQRRRQPRCKLGGSRL